MQRRDFLIAASTVSLATIANPMPIVSKWANLRGKAQHCIFIWLGGGMAQIDTFDPKKLGDAKTNKPGSYYPSIDTAVAKVQVCEHLSGLAPLMDRVTAVRTVHHDVVDEHAAATIRVHTGRRTSGTIQYPSVGSIVAHEYASTNSNIPAYVLIGYPNVARGPGYLGPRYGHLYLTDVETGPVALTPSPQLTDSRRLRRQKLRQTLRGSTTAENAKQIQEYHQIIDQAEKLSSGSFMKTFDLTSESTQTRELYDADVTTGLGKRCLLARRLIESGVSFVEVSHNLNFRNGTGWDTHYKGQMKQHLLIRELDLALSALITDLVQRHLLDSTLIVVATEFGRPAGFDSGGGRGHQSKAFSLVLAGGGLNHRGAYGVTDELAAAIVENPVSVPDFHATIYATLGIDSSKILYDQQNRPIPITDGGQPIHQLLL